MENSPKRRKLDHTGAVAASIDLGVHRHNTFVLETEELLKQVRPTYKESFPDADDALRRVKKAVEAIEPHDAMPIGEAISQFEKARKFAIPFPHPKPSKSSNYKLSLERPAKVNVVGSYVIQTMAKGQGWDTAAIDMVVVMPDSLFQEKDHLNLRYFYKRAYFLAQLAAGVREEVGQEMALEFEYLGENELAPVLVLRPQGSRHTENEDGKTTTKIKQSGYCIKIIPCASANLFPKKKILPTSNGIRPTDNSAKDDLPATPFYNSTIVADMSYMGYLKLLHHTSEQCAAFKDACILGRIWLRQRGIGTKISQGGFGHFEFAAITALLLRPGSGKKGQAALSSSLGSTQIFKAVLRFFSVTDFGNKPCIFGFGKAMRDVAPKEGPTIFDSERGHNISYKMSPWSVSLLRQHAKWSSALFSDDRAGQFSSMFIVKASLPQQMYDLRLTILGASIKAPEVLDKKGDAWNFQDKLYGILERALGERAELIHIENSAQRAWKLSPHTHSPTLGDVRVGIVFDPANMSRKMDKGPEAEDKVNAKKFLQFWGDKSELRRFQDGSMSENVIWTQGTPFGICEEITRYVLQFHLDLGPNDLDFTGSELPSLINASAADNAAFIATKTYFDTLEREIRKLENLPLHVRHVYPVSPELRYSSLWLPPSKYSKDPTRALDVVISFEASSKWPDNLVAIQRAKVAFLERIATRLQGEDEATVKTRLGLEHPARGISKETQNLAFLDIIYDKAVTFRLRIHSDLEESLLERQTKDKLLSDRRIKEESAELLAKLRRDCVTLPLHTQTISRFCTRFPALSPTIRLLKLWLVRHKLSNHFPDELAELLATNVFLHPSPWKAPASPGTAFLRTLQFLARWDWRDEPLILDFSDGEMTTAEASGIETRLEAWRKIDPHMNRTVMFVATNTDASGTAYTHFGPGKVVAARMTALARSACKLVRSSSGWSHSDAEAGGGGGFNKTTHHHHHHQEDMEALFKCSPKEFDISIRLSRRSIRSILAGGGGGGGGGELSKFKNLRDADRRRSSTPKHPVRLFVDTLNELYGDAILFFQGADEGGAGEDGADADADAGAGAGAGAPPVLVLGVWNQQIRARTFRPNLPCSFMPVVGKDSSSEQDDDDDDDDDEDEEDNDDLVEVNRMAILAEIARIGGELVQKIEVNGPAA